MVALSSKGPTMTDSEEAQVLACRKALEFVVEVGFFKLVIEVDNINVMQSITSQQINLSQLGYIYDDIRCIARGLRHVKIKSIRQSANNVGQSLSRHARQIDEDIVWLKDSPPPFQRLCIWIPYLFLHG